jgi:hypothetical protein
MYWEGERRGSDVGAEREREGRGARAASFTRRSSTYDKAKGRELRRCATAPGRRDRGRHPCMTVRPGSRWSKNLPGCAPTRSPARLRGRFSAPRPRRPYAHALYAASPHAQYGRPYVSISPCGGRYALARSWPSFTSHNTAPPRQPTHERRDLQIADGPRSIGSAD